MINRLCVSHAKEENASTRPLPARRANRSCRPHSRQRQGTRGNQREPEGARASCDMPMYDASNHTGACYPEIFPLRSTSKRIQPTHSQAVSIHHHMPEVESSPLNSYTLYPNAPALPPASTGPQIATAGDFIESGRRCTTAPCRTYSITLMNVPGSPTPPRASCAS